MTQDQIAELRERLATKVLFTTIDPAVTLEGKPLPAMTTLLHRVCGNDSEQFEEATRLVELFINEAIKQAESENPHARG